MTKCEGEALVPAKRRRGLWKITAAILASIGMLTTFLVTPAHAANITDGFEAGFIISDDKFYGGNTMTANQVQTFLNQQVPKCTINDPKFPERKTGTPWPNAAGTQRVASDCLKTYKATTTTQPKNEFCNEYTGNKNETAAQIIAKVGKACGINQEVLLVFLEKEMSLVTDSWPTDRMYRSAMGYACPDSGKDNAAVCDSHFYGFFNQVYSAAKQLQRYKKYPQNYSYKAGENNKILWHHIAARNCGSANVYIENAATAALYIYTPYQPNKAALAAGWGLGDQCSSYGNRNFYSLYKSWFGQPNLRFVIHSALSTYAAQQSHWLGTPKAKAVSSAQGVYQVFSGGVLFKPQGHGVNHMTTNSPMLKAHREAGFVTGAWGWPISLATNYGAGNNVKVFQGGTVVESSGKNAYLITPQLQKFWDSTGGFNGSLGAPISKATTGKGGAQQQFAKQTAVVDAAGNATTVDASFLNDWNQQGGISGKLGIPTGKVTQVSANGGGKVYPMSNGAMYRPTGKATVSLTNSALFKEFQQTGGPSGSWGWPLVAETCDKKDTVCTIDFSKGTAVSSSVRGIQFTPYTKIPNITPDPNAQKNLLGGEVQ